MDHHNDDDNNFRYHEQDDEDEEESPLSSSSLRTSVPHPNHHQTVVVSSEQSSSSSSPTIVIQAQEQQHPQARHHTYLPGIITPLLMSSSSIFSSSCGRNFANNSSSNSNIHPSPRWVQPPQDLAILDLSSPDGSSSGSSSNNIVIFPGSIVPFRLLDQEWITYLQQQIAAVAATTKSTSATGAVPVRFGILMPSRTGRSGGIANTSRDTGPSWQRQQRHSWTRQAHGPNTLRRLSQQLLQDLGPDFDLDYNENSDDDDDDDDDNDNDTRNFDSTMIAEPEIVNDGVAIVAPSVPQQQQNETATATADNYDDQVSWILPQYGRENQSNMTRARLYRERRLLSTSPPVTTTNNDNSYSNIASTINRSNDKYIGRIGTIATVLYTHGNDHVQNNATTASNNNNNSNERRTSQSLVITSIGTSRFRIVGYRNTDEQREYNNNNNNHRRRGNLKYFLIEEITDRPLNLPSHIHHRHVIPPHPKRDSSYSNYSDETNHHQRNDTNKATTSPTMIDATMQMNFYEQYVLHLSVVSPYPKHVLYKMWPWKIMADICHYLQTVAPTLITGLLSSLSTERQHQEKIGPICSSSHCHRENTMKVCFNDENVLELPSLDRFLRDKDPIAFSYWMATNLPFRYDEKIELLEIIGVIERLQYIYDKVRNERICASKIHCQHCMTPLAYTYDMFTVEGADGTTGNYVNEHGHVHQTITIRTIEDNEVWYQGQPQSQDSWFPGYSWTIMACAVCGHHLGWKFTTTNNHDPESINDGTYNSSTPSSPQRPSKFYGVSSSNISIFVS